MSQVSYTTSSTGIILSAGVVNSVIVGGTTAATSTHVTLRNGGSTEAIIAQIAIRPDTAQVSLGGYLSSGVYVGTTGPTGGVTVLYQ